MDHSASWTTSFFYNDYFKTHFNFSFQEAQLARSEAEKMASLADLESQRCLALERRMQVMEMQGDEPSSATEQQEVFSEKNRYPEKSIT